MRFQKSFDLRIEKTKETKHRLPARGRAVDGEGEAERVGTGGGGGGRRGVVVVVDIALPPPPSPLSSSPSFHRLADLEATLAATLHVVLCFPE